MNNLKVVFLILQLVFHFFALALVRLLFLPSFCVMYVLACIFSIFSLEECQERWSQNIECYLLCVVRSKIIEAKMVALCVLVFFVFFTQYVSLDVFFPFDSSFFVTFWRLMGGMELECLVMSVACCQEWMSCSSQKLLGGYSHYVFSVQLVALHSF